MMCAEDPKPCADMCQDERCAAFCLGLGKVFAEGSAKLPKSDAQSLAFRARACELDVKIDPSCARVLCEKNVEACRARCDAHSAGQNIADDCSVYLSAPTLRRP